MKTCSYCFEDRLPLVKRGENLQCTDCLEPDRGWWKFTEKRPENTCYYLVFMNNVIDFEHEYTLDIAYYTGETDHDLCPWFDRSRNRLYGVTHWMELPKRPENIKCIPKECICE